MKKSKMPSSDSDKIHCEWQVQTGQDNRGFIALIAVVLLAFGALSFSLATLSAAVSYADSISRRELRIQTGLNVNACIDTVRLMRAKDYFLIGTTSIPEFGCVARIDERSDGSVDIDAKSTLEGVSSYRSFHE